MSDNNHPLEQYRSETERKHSDGPVGNVEIPRRTLLKSIGAATGAGVGITAATTNAEARQGGKNDYLPYEYQTTTLSTGETQRLLSKSRKDDTTVAIEEFVEERGYRLDRSEVEGHQIIRKNKKSNKETDEFRRVTVKLTKPGSDAAPGKLIIRSNGSPVAVQSLLPSTEKETEIDKSKKINPPEAHYSNQRILYETDKKIMDFANWWTLQQDPQQSRSSITTQSVSTQLSSASVSTQSVSGCFEIGATELCAGLGLFGFAAGAIVAVLEPSPLGELTLIQRVGTVGSIAGGVGATCDAVELIDGLVGCESDRYRVCPEVSINSVGVGIIPLCSQ
jgi:hypothetical protein